MVWPREVRAKGPNLLMEGPFPPRIKEAGNKKEKCVGKRKFWLKEPVFGKPGLLKWEGV